MEDGWEIVVTPSLCEQEQIDVTDAFVEWDGSIKIISGVFDEPLEFAAQQEVRNEGVVLTAGGCIFFVRDSEGKVAIYRVAILIVQGDSDIGLFSFAVARLVKIEISNEGLMRKYKERSFSVNGTVSVDDGCREDTRLEFVRREGKIRDGILERK